MVGEIVHSCKETERESERGRERERERERSREGGREGEREKERYAVCPFRGHRKLCTYSDP